MQYLFHKQAGASSLNLTGDAHRYIFKVRRHKKGEKIALRNLLDESIFYYTISFIDKKELHLELNFSEHLSVTVVKKLHIAWCVIEPKNIEKILPTLNELGVAKISFIYCKRSQKNFKLDFERWNKILLNSSQQSGRSTLLELEKVENLKDFLELYPKASMLNFSSNTLNSKTILENIVIGPEGGFTKEELELFSLEKIIGLNTPLILKSESAVLSIASLLLL